MLPSSVRFGSVQLGSLEFASEVNWIGAIDLDFNVLRLGSVQVLGLHLSCVA